MAWFRHPWLQHSPARKAHKEASVSASRRVGTGISPLIVPFFREYAEPGMAEPSYRDVFMRLPEERDNKRADRSARAGLSVAGGGAEVLEAVEEEQARYG